MKYSIKQLVPLDGLSFWVTAADTGEALEIVTMMIERGAKEVEIIDVNGRRYDLIDLEAPSTKNARRRQPGRDCIKHKAVHAGAALKRFRPRL
jgi:hypothetical protein